MPRVSMYGVQHPIIVINDSHEQQEYVIVWHCCESGDILTPKLYDSETIEPITLPKVSIWDTIVIEWTWAYNASMSMKNYNSYPEAWELLIRENWEIVEIRKRQELEDIWRNEIKVI
jgi:diaminopimelate decarboxylase